MSYEMDKFKAEAAGREAERDWTPALPGLFPMPDCTCASTDYKKFGMSRMHMTYCPRHCPKCWYATPCDKHLQINQAYMNAQDKSNG